MPITRSQRPLPAPPSIPPNSAVPSSASGDVLRVDFARTRPRDGAALRALAAGVLPPTERAIAFAPRAANDVVPGDPKLSVELGSSEAPRSGASPWSVVVTKVAEQLGGRPPSQDPGVA